MGGVVQHSFAVLRLLAADSLAQLVPAHLESQTGYIRCDLVESTEASEVSEV